MEPFGWDDVVRSLAHRRGSPFLVVVLTRDRDERVSRVDDTDRTALRQVADLEGTATDRLTTTLFQPPPAEVLHLDTSHIAPAVDV